MADIAFTVRALGANSVSITSDSTFAAADVITYANLKTAVLAYASSEGITGFRNGALYAFLNTAHASDAAAFTAFTEAGGIVSVAASASSTTALPVLKVAQSSLTALVAATGAGCGIRISLAASISA